MKIDLHKVLRGWQVIARDIAIIVVGVLLALWAEQLVQDWEWRKKVHAAEHTMRRELLWDNGPQIYQRAVMDPCLVRQLDAIRAAVEADGSRREVVALIDGYQLEFLSFDRLALDAATASDVAVHMPQESLNRFTDAYAMIPTLHQTNALEAADVARLRALRRTRGPLSEAEASQVLSAVEALRSHLALMRVSARWTLPALRRLGGQLDRDRMQRFMNFVREHYVACAKELPPNWPPPAPYSPEVYRLGRRIAGG